MEFLLRRSDNISNNITNSPASGIITGRKECMRENYMSLTIRKDVLEKLRKLADKNKRSMSQQIEYLVDKELDKE